MRETMGRISCKSKCCYGSSIIIKDDIILWLVEHAFKVDFKQIFDVEYDTKSWAIYEQKHKTEFTDET